MAEPLRLRFWGTSDTGISEVLTTTVNGYDMDNGYLTFQADSPKGFFSFALIAEIPLAATPSTQIAPPPSTSKADLRD